MRDTIMEHVGHPKCPDDTFFSKTKLGEAATLEDIRYKAEIAQPSPELGNYTPFITIFDRKESKYILLNEEYLNSNRPFSEQNTPFTQESPLETQIDYKGQSVQLQVKWICKRKLGPNRRTTV